MFSSSQQNEKVQVNLGQWPGAKEPTCNHELIFGSLHANPLKLIWLLQYYGLLNLKESQYDTLKDDYKNTQYDAKVVAKQFQDVLKNSFVKRDYPVKITLLGGAFCGDGRDDEIMASVFLTMQKATDTLNYVNLFSANEFRFLPIFSGELSQLLRPPIKGPNKDEVLRGNEFCHSTYALQQRLIKLVSSNRQAEAEEIFEQVKEAMFGARPGVTNHPSVFSYSFDGEKIRVYVAEYESWSHIAKGLATCHIYLAKNPTAEQVAAALDQYNARFNENNLTSEQSVDQLDGSEELPDCVTITYGNGDIDQDSEAYSDFTDQVGSCSYQRVIDYKSLKETADHTCWTKLVLVEEVMQGEVFVSTVKYADEKITELTALQGLIGAEAFSFIKDKLSDRERKEFIKLLEKDEHQGWLPKAIENLETESQVIDVARNILVIHQYVDLNKFQSEEDSKGIEVLFDERADFLIRSLMDIQDTDVRKGLIEEFSQLKADSQYQSAIFYEELRYGIIVATKTLSNSSGEDYLKNKEALRQYRCAALAAGLVFCKSNKADEDKNIFQKHMKYQAKICAKELGKTERGLGQALRLINFVREFVHRGLLLLTGHVKSGEMPWKRRSAMNLEREADTLASFTILGDKNDRSVDVENVVKGDGNLDELPTSEQIAGMLSEKLGKECQDKVSIKKFFHKQFSASELQRKVDLLQNKKLFDDAGYLSLDERVAFIKNVFQLKEIDKQRLLKFHHHISYEIDAIFEKKIGGDEGKDKSALMKYQADMLSAVAKYYVGSSDSSEEILKREMQSAKESCQEILEKNEGEGGKSVRGIRHVFHTIFRRSAALALVLGDESQLKSTYYFQKRHSSTRVEDATRKLMSRMHLGRNSE